jgi:YD repeat-containing protein|nr:DNRLRE domain-containing protein [uncultured Blautia sp.]
MTKEKITRSELKEKRTANRKVFENQDHSRTVEIYMEPVHYEDEDGSWKEMDDTLEEVAFGRSIGGTGNRKFCNNKGKLAIQLMDSAEPAATASLTMDTCALRWGMEGAAASVKAEKTEAILLKSENLEENICRITFLPNQMWLKAQERIYPVVIDPVTTTSKKASEIYDAHVDSLYEEDNFQKSIILKTMGGDEVQRSFIRFELPEMKTGDMVVSARLVLVSLAEDNKERTVEVHKVLHAWNSNSINWYNKPLYSETIEDLCCYKGDKQKYITMDITRMVKDWYQNGGNYGLMLKDDYELSGYTEFLSSDCDNGYQDMRPRIDISYVNYSGLEDYWTYHSQDAGRAGTVHVNDYNGNLIMIHDTMNTEGSLEPMALSHVYNSNNCATDLGYGYGFALNYHQTLVKTKIGGTDYYKHTDGDGTIHYFYYDSTEKKWKDESGLEQTLTIHTDGTEQLVIHDKEDNQLRFRNGWLVKVQDKNGNCLSISWAEQRIISITDGSGRKTTLDYLLDNNGKRTTLTQITGPSGNKKTFTYGSGNLTGITDIDGEKVKYVYNGNHMLTEVHNIDGYSVKYGYYGTKPYRVKSITEYAGTQKGNSLSLTYGYNSTKFTDNKKRSEIYRFNNSGNLIHIHDGFGHAASGKYNRSGNHVNCLENATKLQTNVVQLLKDPIIQAATCGWKTEISSDGSGKTEINTNTALCKVGNRSLKLESTAKTGSVCWYQDVSLLKGQTYTASMFVKVTKMDRASDGAVFLRARYQDKDNVWHYEDSEQLKSTTTDFIHLHKTFTLPADIVKTSVRVYLVAMHTICTVYGDMAQLETGSTVSRCNLVDNGDFHLGTTSGFTKTGSFEDGLTSVGTSNIIPVQSAIVVSAAKSTVYATPSLNGTKVVEVTKGTHLYALCYEKNEDIYWYKVRTAAGKRGYLHGGHATAYLGGNTGDHSAVVGVSGAVLRSSASDSGSIVEEAIPRGTCAVVRSVKTDADGKNWLYLGMQIDKKRYTGYMKEESALSHPDIAH